MKKLDNGQLIHIITEVVVLLGITMYFSNKNKRLQSLIEELSQRIEEQDDQIQKMQNVLQQVVNQQNMLKQKVDTPVEKKKKTVTIQDIKPKVVKKPVVVSKEPQVQSQSPQPPQPPANLANLLTGMMGLRPAFSPNIEVVPEETDEPDISDDELDEELEDEISEMNNETQLKKN